MVILQPVNFALGWPAYDLPMMSKKQQYSNIHDEPTFRRAVDYLCGIDLVLADIVERHGAPPRWQRAPGFASLLYIILEQQVSLASARAVYRRLSALAESLTPESFLLLDDAQLQGTGFSRQKIIYGRTLAQAHSMLSRSAAKPLRTSRAQLSAGTPSSLSPIAGTGAPAGSMLIPA